MVIPDLKICGDVSAGNQVSAHKISNIVRIRQITNRIFVQNLDNTNRNFGLERGFRGFSKGVHSFHLL